MRRILPLLLILGGCVVQEHDESSGQHVVTSYARLHGVSGTRRDNEDVAKDVCPEGYILHDERLGQNDDGHFRRWVFACIAR
jgi:hypothetical protein